MIDSIRKITTKDNLIYNCIDFHNIKIQFETQSSKSWYKPYGSRRFMYSRLFFTRSFLLISDDMCAFAFLKFPRPLSLILFKAGIVLYNNLKTKVLSIPSITKMLNLWFFSLMQWNVHCQNYGKIFPNEITKTNIIIGIQYYL